MHFRILLAEDNAADADLIRECLEEWRRPVELVHVTNGDQALRWLESHPPPDLMLLDLRMPQRDGLDVLGTMKEDPRLLLIPVIMLTTSAAPRDVQAAYDRHVNTFFQKPMHFDGYRELITLIELYWSSRAELPSKGPPWPDAP